MLIVEWQKGDDWIRGKIAMNDELVMVGTGTYEHMKAGAPLFGLWSVAVHGETLLVHTTYSDADRTVFQAAEWHRMPLDEES